MSRSWFDVHIATDQKQLNSVKQRIIGFPEEAMKKYYFQLLQELLAATVDVVQNYIASGAVSTPTGQGEGRRGRVKSGTMKDSVSWSFETGSKPYRFTFGWLQSEPYYSIFQEYGTKNGVVGMESLKYGREFLLAELKLRGARGSATKAPNPRAGI